MITDPARWRRVRDLFAAALELAPAERSALLDRACQGDDALRGELESLLVSHERSGAIDRLAGEMLSPAVVQVHEPAGIEPGRAISHYVVQDALGAGGMGVVYRARDERLQRLVALKCLPPHRIADAAAKRRFMTEARAVAALEHPNICAIYEVGETDDGQPFIAMPLYEGETLHVRLARGTLRIDQAVSIAREMALGLAAAHQHGIIHRDVKPSNVMLLSDDRVKILDFGVAKMEGVTLTGTGTTLGTVAYMSPEQIRGEQIDHRADIWALGVVLYEMLTGRKPFEADTQTAAAYAINLRAQLPPSQLRDEIPPEVDDLVATALAKLPERRYASMADVAAAIDQLKPDARQHEASEKTVVSDRRPPDDAAAAPAAERRRAAVLVTLLSDYASILEQLDPADVDDVVASVRAAAVDAVRRYGGLVNQALGEEIVSLFGVPAGHEDDDLRAVRAALDLHARVRAIVTPALERHGLRLVVQSGIDAGSLVAQRLREGPRRYAISGAPPQTAARLSALAAPDAILVSPDCHALVHPFVASQPTPPVTLRPGAAPIAPHRVIGESGAHTRIEAAERSALSPFTGRAPELTTLENIVVEACSGHGRIATVVGDAGIGKSRLIHELRERVRTLGVRLLMGRCRSYGGISPYAPIVEVMRDILGARPEDDAARIVHRTREIDGALEPFIPFYLHLLSVRSEEFAVARHLQGEHFRAALLDAVVALVLAAAAHSPLLVLLEDWQWADDASREVLQRVAEVVDSHHIAIVVATRPEPQLLAELASKSTLVQLEPLERSASTVLLRALLGAERISASLASGIQERTAGNPFFLEQVVHALREEGAVVTTHGEAMLARDIGTLRLPATVQAVIRARLDRLDGDAREVLRVASVIGREFERGLLAGAVPPHIDTARALERLRSAALIQQLRVVPEPAYRFKHVLTQDVAYDSLLEHQRKAAHGAIGRALQRQTAGREDEHAESLAHHFARAESWPEAIDYSRRAAERLRALSEYANALAMFDRLQQWIDRLPANSEKRGLLVDTLLEQERLCETLGQRRRQQEIITQLISLLAPLGPSSRLAEAYLRQGDLLTLLKQFDAAEAPLKIAVAYSRDLDDKRLERSTLRSVGLLRWHQDRHAEALALAQKALAFDRALSDEPSIIADLANIGSIYRAMGDYDRAQAVLEEALAMPAAAREPRSTSSVLHNLANVCRARGDLGAALDYLQRADDATRVHMLPLYRSFHLIAIAHLRLQMGDVEAAIQTYKQAVDLSRRARHAEGLAQALRLLGDVELGVGQTAEAAAHFSEAATLFAQLQDRESEADLWARIANVRERLGEWGPARDAWIAVLDLRRAMGASMSELDAREGVARALRHLGHAADAITAFNQALALATKAGDGRRQLTLHNTLGILHWERGAYSDALHHYDAGLHQCRLAGDRVHEGLMLNSMGVAFTRLKRYDEARAVLKESVTLNRDTGERLLEAHALAALADISVQLGQPGNARQYLEAALALRRRLNDEPGVAEVSRLIAQLEGSHAGSGPH